MSKKKKISIIVGSLFVLLIISLFLNVSVAGEPGDAGGCISISFDKWDMQRADKVIIYYGGEQYTVTDTEFIQALTRQTLAGTSSEYCCSHFEDGWVEIYRGDRLIRRMRYVEAHGALAYEADIGHWVLNGEESHAFLSRDVENQLRQIIGKN
ncbi:MAG: hypothetical protein E7466_03890 [Ruminococcaceae bacterium]|nr:hypothetical protein [Oscillospiraceae bacterium]